jgi:hypothetical protein
MEEMPDQTEIQEQMVLLGTQAMQVMPELMELLV